MPKSLVLAEREQVQNMLMLPPSGLPSKRKRKEVLEEEEYVEALSHIIERDYFPQLAASRASEREDSRLDGLSVDSFFQQYTSYDNDSFEELQMKSVEDHKRQYPWLYELPDDGTGQQRRSGMMMLYYLGDKVLTNEQRHKMEAIMNEPANVGDSRPNGSQPGRFRVRNQLMFPPELAVSEDVCRMRDHEAADLAQDSTHHQKKKSILPGEQDLQAVLRLTNGEGSSAGGSERALNNRTNNIAALQQALVRYNKRYSGLVVRSEKTIQRNNTSLPAPSALSSAPTLTSEQLLSWDRSYRARQQGGALTAVVGGRFVLEEPHTPSLRSSGGGSTVGDSASECSDMPFHRQGVREYATVPMSPCPEPGAGALQSLTPLFTWGSVEGTPLLLHQATPAPAPVQSRGGAGSGDSQQQKHQLHLLQERLVEAEDRRMKALQTQAFEEEEKGLPRFALRPASHREQLARTIDSGRQNLTTQQSRSRSGETRERHSSTVRTGEGSVLRSVRGSDQRKRSRAEDLSDEMSVDERRNYYRSANQAAHLPSPAPSLHSAASTSGISTRKGPPPPPTSSSSSTLSAAQRLARLTPAARALALKLHKNLTAPPTPLG